MKPEFDKATEVPEIKPMEYPEIEFIDPMPWIWGIK